VVRDRYSDARVAAHVRGLDPAFRSVEHDEAVVKVHPHRRHLGRAVRHDGGDVSVVLAFEELPDLGRELYSHGGTSFTKYVAL
jgi:hypothetical protein